MRKRISDCSRGKNPRKGLLWLEVLKPDVSYRGQFRRNSVVNRKDFAAVELLLRRGYRQLETYSSAGVKNITG